MYWFELHQIGNQEQWLHDNEIIDFFTVKILFHLLYAKV
jgi:hypothetical protein